MRYLLFRMKRFCGFSVGFVFFISGILKLMDPVGSSLVMQAYFKFFHIGFLDFTAKPLAMVLALTESVIGAGLVTGVWRKALAPIAVGLQIFFTIITLFLLIFNPEMDCGCFGEAIHLTHGETFTKNIVLLTLLLIYYIPAKYLGQTKKKKYISFAIVTASTLMFTIYSYNRLPLYDFTAYHVGADLKVSGNKETPIYDALFIYEKNGIQETFTIENIPDSTWSFVRTETISDTEKEDKAATLSFYNEAGEYADSIVLHGKVLIISVYNSNISVSQKNKIRTLTKIAEEQGITPIILTSFHTKDFEDGFNHYSSDRKTLMTLNRSNGGATLLEDGVIVQKWAKKSLPDTEELTKILEEDVTETIIGNSGNSIAFQGFMLYVFAVMLLL